MSKLKQDVQVWYVCWRLSAVLCAGERKVKEETQQNWTEQWELGPCSVSFSTNNCSLRDFILSRIQLQFPQEEHRPGRRSPGVRVNVWTNTHTTWNKLARSLYCISCCKYIYPLFLCSPQGQQSNSIESEIWQSWQQIWADNTSRLYPSGGSVPWLETLFHLILCCDKNSWCTGCDSEEKVLSWGDKETFPTCFSTPNCNRLHNVESFDFFPF